MSQQGRLQETESGLESLTGNVGGPILPDGAGNINIVGGTNINVTGNPGTYTLTITSSGGINWIEITGTSSSTSPEEGYISNNAGLVTFTLPATIAFGETIRIGGKGAGGWSIAQNAGQTINFGISSTTTGVGGSLSSTNIFDAVELICVTANTQFIVLSSIGNLQVV